MVRRIIHINQEKCNGCGLCAEACHEGAIGMVDGKATLLRDDYCDGLGDCLPTCPTGAITFVEREAAAYDEAAVKENQRKKAAEKTAPLACGCPGTHSKRIQHENATTSVAPVQASSQLSQWPVQIKLAPLNAPYFENAHLLIAADCTAYAYGNFHQDFMENKVTLIGCPKLDAVDYSEKLTEILKNNAVKEVTVARMEVPCCGGIERAVLTALQNSEKNIPWKVVTISIKGRILDKKSGE